MNFQLSCPTYKSSMIPVDGGPLLQVNFQCKQGQIFRIRLSHATQFQWMIETDEEFEPLYQSIKDWMQAYSQKKSHPLPPMNRSTLTPFMIQVLKEIETIPFGETCTYQQLAEQLGSPKGARAIGTGCGRNPFPLLIPCHRVVGSNGSLGGYTPDLSLKKALLEYESSLAS